MADAVMYFLRGNKHTENAMVSFWSLRRHWLGPVQIVVADADGMEAATAIRDWDPMQATQITEIAPDTHRRGGTYCTKTKLPGCSVFDRTIFLDADTLVCGDISPLLPNAERTNPVNGHCEYEVVLTRFAEWTTAGTKMTGRIKAWQEVAPDEVAKILSKPWPAINTGVIGWSGTGGEFSRKWRTLCLKRVAFICDEVSLNILIPYLPHRMLDDRYNASPIYSSAATKSAAIIWHFHGGKGLKSDAGWAIWGPALDQARAEMPCLADWLAVRTPQTNYLLQDRLDHGTTAAIFAAAFRR